MRRSDLVAMRPGATLVVLLASGASALALTPPARAGAEPADARPARAVMHVLDGARAPRDRVPARLARHLDGVEGLQAERSKLLRSGLGRWRARLFAVPTVSGGVCWTSRITAGCVGTFDEAEGPDGIALSVRTVAGPAAVVILGLAPDDVEWVEVRGDGVRRRMPVRCNAFFAELAGGRGRPDLVVIGYRDGRRLEQPVAGVA